MLMTVGVRKGKNTLEDAEFEELLEADLCQTQNSLAPALESTCQAIYKRTHVLGMNQNQITLFSMI